MGKVLSAQGSGYFPFCLTKGTPPSTGIDTEYPISLSLTKYMSWWWKVKTWNVTGSSTGNESWSGGGYNNWTTTELVQDEYWTSSISSEENLVCQTYRRLSFGFTAFASRSDGDQPFTNTSDIYFLAEAYIDGTIIYPRILVNGWYNISPSLYSNVAAALDPASHLTIDGIVIPCHIYWNPDQHENSWSWTGSQNFVINPSTYWTYA